MPQSKKEAQCGKLMSFVLFFTLRAKISSFYSSPMGTKLN